MNNDGTKRFYFHNALKFPIKYGILYSIMTVVVYLFGVWKYPETNRTLFIIIIVVYNFMMYSGFLLGTKLKSKAYMSSQNKKKSLDFIWSLYKICQLVIIIFTIPQFIILTGMYQSFDITNIIDRISFAISDVNAAYVDSHHFGVSATGIWKFINYGVVLFGGVMWIYTPISILLWKKLRTTGKVLAVLYWAVYISQYIITGTNAGVVGLIFYIGMTYVLMKKNTRLFPLKKSLSGRKSSKSTLVTILTILLILWGFGYAMASRVGTNYSTKIIGSSIIEYNDDSIFNSLLPNSLEPTFAVMNSYLAQGYYAFEMAISVEWNPSVFIRSSRFIMSNTEDLLNIDLFNTTYQYILYETNGWHYDINWHTAYLWIANDFSIFGVPLALFFLFLFWGKSWKSYIKYNNILGLLQTVIFANFIFYISANNAVFSYYQNLFAVILIIFLQIIYSKKIDWIELRL